MDKINAIYDDFKALNENIISKEENFLTDIILNLGTLYEKMSSIAGLDKRHYYFTKKVEEHINEKEIIFENIIFYFGLDTDKTANLISIIERTLEQKKLNPLDMEEWDKLIHDFNMKGAFPFITAKISIGLNLDDNNFKGVFTFLTVPETLTFLRDNLLLTAWVQTLSFEALSQAINENDKKIQEIFENDKNLRELNTFILADAIKKTMSLFLDRYQILPSIPDNFIKLLGEKNVELLKDLRNSFEYISKLPQISKEEKKGYSFEELFKKPEIDLDL